LVIAFSRQLWGANAEPNPEPTHAILDAVLAPLHLEDTALTLPSPIPCPHCGSQGELNPIILMEAIGCDRCQSLFTLSNPDLILEQIASPTPTPRRWRWTGQHWRRLPPPQQSPWILGAALVIVLTLLWMPVLLNGAVPGLMPLWLAVFFGGVVLPGVVLWVTYRR